MLFKKILDKKIIIIFNCQYIFLVIIRKTRIKIYKLLNDI